MRRCALLSLVAACVAALRHRPDVQLAGKKAQHNVALGPSYSVKLSNYQNVQYHGPFGVGNQEFPVIYDTGSFDVLVLSTKCWSCAQNAPVYDSSRSTSFKATPYQATHTFGSGPTTSDRGLETLTIGAAGSPYVGYDRPFYEIIDHSIDAWGPDSEFSGIVGMGHISHSPMAAEGEFKDQTLLDFLGIGSFAFCLERADGGAGWMTIGPTVTPGLFHNIPVVGNVHWGVKLSGFSANGVVATNPCNPSCGAIVDSGTSLIAIPSAGRDLIDKLEKMIKRDCSNVAELPDLRIDFDGISLVLPPQAYVMKVTGLELKSSIWQTLWSGPVYAEEVVCLPAFMDIDMTTQYGPMIILGMPFLRYYYSAFDRVGMNLQVSRASPSCQPMGMYAPFNFVANSTDGTNSSGALDVSRMPLEIVNASSLRLPPWARQRGGHLLL